MNYLISRSIQNARFVNPLWIWPVVVVVIVMFVPWLVLLLLLIIWLIVEALLTGLAVRQLILKPMRSRC